MPLLIHFIINIKVNHDYLQQQIKHVITSQQTQHIPITDRDNNITLNSRYDSQSLPNNKQRVIGIGREARLIWVTSGIGHVTRIEMQHMDSKRATRVKL